ARRGRRWRCRRRGPCSQPLTQPFELAALLGGTAALVVVVRVDDDLPLRIGAGRAAVVVVRREHGGRRADHVPQGHREQRGRGRTAPQVQGVDVGQGREGLL